MPGTWYPLRVAGASSWRLSTVLTTVVLVPATPALVLVGDLLGSGAALTLAAALLAFCASFLVHELGHCAAHWWLARDPGARTALAPVGEWHRARVVRVTLGRADVVVSVAGPAAALLFGGIVALTVARVSVWPPALLVAPFTLHVLALLPWVDDGRQILHVMRGR